MFEYSIVWSNGTAKDLETLNALGAKGWELVGIDRGWMYLKRIKPKTAPRKPAKTKAKK